MFSVEQEVKIEWKMKRTILIKLIENKKLKKDFVQTPFPNVMIGLF